MVSVKVVANKGVEHKEYKKDGKHRIYFKESENGGRPIEIGNYDLIEDKFFKDRKFGGNEWVILDSADNARALIVIGDDRKVFVGPNNGNGSSKTKFTDTQSRITLGMCINNATVIVASRMNTDLVLASQSDGQVADSIMNLAEELLREYNSRFN